MGAQESSFNVRNFTHRDIGEAVNILRPLVPNQPVLKDLVFALKKGFFKGIRRRGKIIAIAAGHFGENGVSLSYFYIDPFYRGKPLSLFFIAHIMSMFAGAKVYIHSENTEGFAKYFKETDEPNEYEWIGFGDRVQKLIRDGRWAA